MADEIVPVRPYMPSRTSDVNPLALNTPLGNGPFKIMFCNTRVCRPVSEPIVAGKVPVRFPLNANDRRFTSAPTALGTVPVIPLPTTLRYCRLVKPNRALGRVPVQYSPPRERKFKLVSRPSEEGRVPESMSLPSKLRYVKAVRFERAEGTVPVRAFIKPRFKYCSLYKEERNQGTGFPIAGSGLPNPLHPYRLRTLRFAMVATESGSDPVRPAWL